MATKVVEGLSNISELFENIKDNENGEEIGFAKPTVNKYDIVSVISYMIGVDDEFLDKHTSVQFQDEIKELRCNKEATIIRYLSRLRTRLMLNFKKTDDEILYNLGNIDRMDYYDRAEINKLIFWGIPAVQPNFRADQYSEHFCKLIEANIDNCKGLFPDWVKFEYIRDIFVVPKYNKTEVMRAEFSKYQEHLYEYPFQCYIHWEPDGKGNLINSDGRFLNAIYAQHDDYFFDSSKYHDAADHTKESIYDFVRRSERIVFVVDCENSDVYKLYGVLKNLEAEELEKVEKIILYDDYHTSCGWDWLEKFINIPVEHVEVERVTDRKSLVDIKMTAGVCEAYYSHNIGSFILCSSDSDFWGLISSLPKASFLVMYEYSKCGQDIKDALATRNIYHCSIDDFYTGNAEELKKKVLISELKKEVPTIIGKNGRQLAKKIYERTKISVTPGEMDRFYEKYIKTLRLKMDENGEFYIEIIE